MLSVAVADDDPAVTRKIRDLIRADEPHADVELFASGEAILLSGRSFDIVYMDIRMEGTNGIDAARRLRERRSDTLLIFISALKEYVFDALDLHPFHFLVKPVEEGRFLRVFHEAKDTVETAKTRSGQRLVVTSRGQNISVPVGEIQYIERNARTLEVHAQSGVYEMYGSLNRLEEDLGGRFYRCHRAYLVNLAWVASYSGDSIVLRDGQKVLLAQKKAKAFATRYLWFLQENNGS